MPIIRVLKKPPVMVQWKDSKGKKQLIKSGPNAGQIKMRIKTAAKFKNELDVPYIYNSFKNADIVVIEQQGTTVGNTAQATKTTSINLGKLLACAELAQCKIVMVTAAKWKADLGLSKEKLEAVELAEKLSGRNFRTIKSALRDGPAEAFLIYYWYINYGEENE